MSRAEKSWQSAWFLPLDSCSKHFRNIYSLGEENAQNKRTVYDKNWTSSQLVMIPLRVYANAKFKTLLLVVRSFVYVNFQVIKRVGERAKAREKTRIVYLCNAKMTHFTGFRLKEKLIAWNGKILWSKRTPLTCILYCFGFHSVCTLSACTYFDCRSIASVKCKCTIAPKAMKRNEKKRIQERNEWMNGKRDEQKKEAYSHTETQAYKARHTMETVCAHTKPY